MENYMLQEDIRLLCFKAAAFPDGIAAAHEKLAAIVAPDSRRFAYGVSYLYDDEILYMAAVGLPKGETAIPAGCQTYTLKKGNYISIYIPDFATDISQIEKVFKELLAHPGIDENGCCAECYFPGGRNGDNAKDIRCMVRLAD